MREHLGYGSATEGGALEQHAGYGRAAMLEHPGYGSAAVGSALEHPGYGSATVGGALATAAPPCWSTLATAATVAHAGSTTNDVGIP